MSQQQDHVEYTRSEWTTVPIFRQMIDYLKTKQIASFADIGANVGEVSKILLEEIPSLKKVYCYEPESTNFNFMRDRFLSDSRVIPVKKAVFYDYENKVGFLQANGWCGSHTLVKNTGVFVERIELTTIEEEKLNEIDLVKLDIEGAEYNVIQNSPSLKDVKYLIVEFHPFGVPDASWYKDLPLGSEPEQHEKRSNYVKAYVDKFISEYLPTHRVICADTQVQCLLERID